MNIFKWIKKTIVNKRDFYKKSKIFVAVRRYDFDKAKEFYEHYKNDIEQMSFIMKKDINIEQIIVENGELLYPFEFLIDVDGVTETVIDSPSIYVKFKNNKEWYFYCFKEYYRNLTRTETCFRGGLLNPHCVKIFKPWKDKISYFNLAYNHPNDYKEL